MEGPLEKSKKAGKKMILDLVSPDNHFLIFFLMGWDFVTELTRFLRLGSGQTLVSPKRRRLAPRRCGAHGDGETGVVQTEGDGAALRFQLG